MHSRPIAKLRIKRRALSERMRLRSSGIPAASTPQTAGTAIGAISVTGIRIVPSSKAGNTQSKAIINAMCTSEYMRSIRHR